MSANARGSQWLAPCSAWGSAQHVGLVSARALRPLTFPASSSVFWAASQPVQEAITFAQAVFRVTRSPAGQGQPRKCSMEAASPSTEGGTPSASSPHADGLDVVAPAPRVSLGAVEDCPIPQLVILALRGAPCPRSLNQVPLARLSCCLQVRAFPIVGANPGPRCAAAAPAPRLCWRRRGGGCRRLAPTTRQTLRCTPVCCTRRCGHTLTTIAGPDGDLSSAKLVLFGARGGRCAASARTCSGWGAN